MLVSKHLGTFKCLSTILNVPALVCELTLQTRAHSGGAWHLPGHANLFKAAALQVNKNLGQKPKRRRISLIPSYGEKVSILKVRVGAGDFRVRFARLASRAQGDKVTKGLDYCKSYKYVVRPIDFYSQVFVM